MKKIINTILYLLSLVVLLLIPAYYAYYKSIHETGALNAVRSEIGFIIPFMIIGIFAVRWFGNNFVQK